MTRRTPGPLRFPLVVIPFFFGFASKVGNFLQSVLQALVFFLEFLDLVDQIASGFYCHFLCSFRVHHLNVSPFGVVFQGLVFNFSHSVVVSENVTGKPDGLGLAGLELLASQGFHAS